MAPPRPGCRAILICLPRASRLRAAPGIRFFRSDFDPDEVCLVDGIRVTTAARTAFDLARLRDTTSGVIALDRLANLRLIDLGDLASLFGDRRRWEGARRGLQSTLAADAGAESPPETVTRLLCASMGLTGLLANPTVLGVDGEFVARVDLLDPATGLVIEYDGAHHASAGQRQRDAAREERLESLGLIVVRVTGADLATEQSRRALGVRIVQARGRAKLSSASARRWNLAR